MSFILTLFWWGLIIAIALLVFRVVLILLGMLLVGLLTAVAWAIELYQNRT